MKYNLWRPEASVVFVGYQAHGTLGRLIEEGAKKVKILGDEIGVLAEIHRIEGFSGHADRDGLLKWLEGFTVKPKKVFVVHGEKDSAEAFAGLVEQKLGMETIVPKMGETVGISLMEAVITGKKQPEDSAARCEVPEVCDVTLKIMQVKIKFMEAMDSLNKSVISGELEAEEASRIIEEIQRTLGKEKAG